MSKKTGEILIANGLVTRKMLDEALEHQAKAGGNVIQYLIAMEYVREEDLARCISLQFGYPYLPLRAYDIPVDVIKSIPLDMARKYWLMPIDMIENIITLVMADPFDDEAISEVEKLTGCKVQPFVGVLSDILKAIEKYYDTKLEYEELIKDKRAAPLLVSGDKYKGVERRRSVRIKANIQIHFPLQNEYRAARTKDISAHGFLFESPNILPVDSFLMMEIDLPKHISLYSVPAIVQVVRVVGLPDKKFDIGVKIVKMSKEDMEKVIRYALSTVRS